MTAKPTYTATTTTLGPGLKVVTYEDKKTGATLAKVAGGPDHASYSLFPAQEGITYYATHHEAISIRDAKRRIIMDLVARGYRAAR